MRCTNCGWENPEGRTTCEKCDSPLQGGTAGTKSNDLHSTILESQPFEKPHNDTREVPQDKPNRPKTAPTYVDGGTVNPYAGGAGFIPQSHCKLSPVIFPGEDKRDVPPEASFKGTYNELNRANLDPENNTITSKVQATLTNKDGKWYIQDQSAQQTTYVRAAEPTPLKTGDIILIGNRTFIFSED